MIGGHENSIIEEIGDMSWTIPQFSKTEIDKAGDALASGGASDQDRKIVENWRSAHSYPLQVFDKDLHLRAKGTNGCVLVAQRLKRQISIAEKLKFSTLRLSAVQDIGGCRAVMRDIDGVRALLNDYENPDHRKYYKKYDYILKPKPSGYRGIHLVYKYEGKKTEFRDLKIEIQIRTLDQHAWATAVETVGLFTNQALKSNRGGSGWLRFFQLMGNAIAHKEDANPVPGTPSFDDGLQVTLASYANKLDVFSTLRTYESTLKQLPSLNASSRYYLLILDPHSMQLEMYGYAKHELEKAYREYSRMERQTEWDKTRKNVVLVSADSLEELKNAYPNYFFSTGLFLSLVEWAIRPPALPYNIV